MKAKYPLREAKVEVKEIPGKPGSYNAVAYLRPWLQMEELTTSHAHGRAHSAEGLIAAGRGRSTRRDAAGSRPDPPVALRAAVLSGRFLGQGAGAAARRPLAAFLTERSAAACITRLVRRRGLARILRMTARRAAPAADRGGCEEAVDRDIAALDRADRRAARRRAAPRPRCAASKAPGAAWPGWSSRVPFGARVKLRVLPARWAELCRDFERALEFDQIRPVQQGLRGASSARPAASPSACWSRDYEVRHAPGPGSPTDDVAGARRPGRRRRRGLRAGGRRRASGAAGLRQPCPASAPRPT